MAAAEFFIAGSAAGRLRSLGHLSPEFLRDESFISRPPPPPPPNVERQTWEEIKVEIVFRKTARKKVSRLEVVY